MFTILSQSPVFHGMEAGEIREILDKVNYRTKRYKKGKVIALRKEVCNDLMVIISGSVKGEMLDFSGKVIKIEDIEAPRVVASAFLFGRHNLFPVDIIANDEVEILVIPKSSVIQLMQKSRTFLINYLNVISDRAQFLSNKLFFLSFRTIRGKLAQFILSLSGKDNRQIRIPKTQKELAEIFGVTRPALARVLGEMEKERIIDVSRKQITILDRNRLSDLIR
ncbi:MAG: Crp/Fnr family transcriptional regulator [Bacteroidales bacterium]|nr:MAG: Crp/Fnr family transcriptional regulator [Bacteroidales bacterium]